MEYYLKATPVAAFIFLITLITSATALMGDRRLMDRFILSPYRVVKFREYYRLVTCSLLHGDFFHLFFNLMTFYFFAPTLESHNMGHWKFGVVYLFSLIVSGIYPTAKHRNNPQYLALGASGAISGVLFSFILFQPTAMLGVFMVIPMPAWLFAILYLAFSWWMGRRGGDNIGHDAHFWGAIAGLVITPILEPVVLQYLRMHIERLLG